MTNISIYMLISAFFVVMGVFALVTRHDTVSTRHKATQLIIVLAIIGGLMGIKGNHVVGLIISTLASLAYMIRLYRYRKDIQTCRRLGIKMPEYKKP